jgi:peptidoglycan-associated lipoprotein
MMLRVRFYSMVLLLVGLVAACASNVKLDENAGTINDTNTDGVMPGMQTGAADTRASTQTGLDPVDDPRSPLAQRRIYFDFNQYIVKPDFLPLLQQHANYLKTHPQRRILIQGSTDERGTSEYNLALGQKRAEATRQALLLMGVPALQLEAVSLGKEYAGHGETSWDQDRRADLVYQ